MFRTIRTAVTATATAAAVLAAASAGALAGQQDFTIVNASYQDIFYVFVSPDTSDSWGNDVLEDYILPSGGYADIQMDGYGNHCYFDIQVASYSGETLEFWGVDLCTVSEVVVQ